MHPPGNAGGREVSRGSNRFMSVLLVTWTSAGNLPTGSDRKG
jgi:hypothetical protein